MAEPVLPGGIDSRAHAGTRAWLAAPAHGQWLDGRAVEAASGKRLVVLNPASGLPIAEVPDSGAADAAAAAVSALAAFESGPWPRLPAPERERVLLRLAELVEARAEELRHLIVLENGKLLSAAAREVEGCVRFIRYAAGWATKITGETLDTGLEAAGAGFAAFTRREPVGVVAGIIPWNVPLAMAAWKSVPALACGCTVVLKPAPETPLAALRLAELALEAGLPPGALNVVTGGTEPGAALVEHPAVAKVAFTGSTAAGRVVGARAAGLLKRVSLELGGKSPAVVFADADLESAARAVAQGIFYNQGQICAAGSRLYVERSVFDDLVGAVSAIARTMRIGDGLDPGSELGPLVSEAQRARVIGYIERGVADGARAAAGGSAPDRAGFFVSPTILTGTGPEMAVVREEIFGPVLVAMPFGTEAEALSLMNDSAYGLSASLYTGDLSRAHRLIPRIRAGSVFVNTPARTDPALPLGGFKASGIGREHGSAMIELYTEIKAVVIRYDSEPRADP